MSHQALSRPGESRARALLFVALALSGTVPVIEAQPPKSAASPALHVAVVGQALIKTDLRHAAPVAVEQARRYLRGADVRFTNLETAIAPKEAAVTPRPPATRTDPDVLDCLKDMGFNLLSLSNNHAWDHPPWLVEWTHRLIDAGATMYVGHGDPVLHGVEIYKGRPIFYGLGNFIFHTGNTPDNWGPLAFMGAIAHAEFKGGALTALSFQPIVLSLDTVAGARRGTPYLAEGVEAAAILGRLADLSRQYGTEMRVTADRATVVMK